MVNKVILLGRLGTDPEIRYTLDGKPVATMRLATNEVIIRDGEKEIHTEWHTLVAFGRLAEICGEYLNKGSRIYVEGSLRTRKYEDRSGTPRTRTEILIHKLLLLDKYGDMSKKDSFSSDSNFEEPAIPDDLPF